MSDGLVITVKYSCAGCGLTKVNCDVSARVGEDVVAWMDQTIRLLASDHRRRSPNCHPESLQDVMIPITGADRVGGPSVS